MKVMIDVSAKTEAEELSRLIVTERKKRFRIQIVILVGILVQLCLIAAYLSRLFKAPPVTLDSANVLLRTTLWVLGFTIVFSSISIFATFRLLMHPSRIQRRAALKLAESSDTNVIPGLLDAWSTQYKVPQIRAALVALLPKLRRDNAEMFTDWQLRVLSGMAIFVVLKESLRRKYCEFEDLVIPGIQALGYVGNRTSMKDLERIISATAKTERDFQIKAEAEKAFSLLRAYIDEEERGGTLVRPSTAIADGSTMLRPAANLAQSAEDNLVMPALEPIFESISSLAQPREESSITQELKNFT